MTSNETPAPHNSAAAALAAIDHADNLRAQNDQGDDSGMPQAAVYAQLAHAHASLAIAQAIHELAATIRDNPGGATTW